jgi:PIN domain nuclease of toxin-antitoxin system
VNVLLDTHVWIWCLSSPERLSRRAVSAITGPKAEAWLSPISLWELDMLAERGRIRLPSGHTAAAWAREALERAPLRDAPLTREVVWRTRDIRVEHGDPADRFLAATAAAYDLTLVTADERLLAGRGFRTMDCR